jgi:hypothetical protein
MAKVEVLLNDDGSTKIHPATKEPWLHYTLDDGESVIQTSPFVTEKVTLSDGTSYDLSPRIVVPKNEHLAELVAAHDRLHEANKPPPDDVDASRQADLDAAATPV